MDPSFQSHIHYPSSLTRADVAVVEIDSLDIGPLLGSSPHDQSSITSTHTARIKALGRYEVGTPLASYDQKDLVFLPNAVPKYAPAGLLHSLCDEQGLDAANVLLEMQGVREEVSCEECGFDKIFVLPEKAKKVVVIRDEDGEVVRAGNSADVKGRAPSREMSADEVAVQQVSSMGALRSEETNTSKSGTMCVPAPLTPEPTTRRNFDPEAVAFDFAPLTAQVDTKSSPAEPDATPDADEVQGLQPASYDYIRSPSRCTVERWSFSTATTANDREALYQEWLTVGCSSSNCEHCGFVSQAPPREGESTGASLEVFVQAGRRYDVGCEVHETCRSSPVRRICGRCLEDEES